MDPDPMGPKKYPQHFFQFRTTNTTFNSFFFVLNSPAGHNEDILGILHSSDGPGSQKHLQ
jgi:hypothetical protein